MAALELHCGLDHGVWGGERVDLLDSFDSEMQEWEEQLQDMQRKIEELYKEVESRRGATEHRSESGTKSTDLNITLLPVNTPNHCPVSRFDNLNGCQGDGRAARLVDSCGGKRHGVPAMHANTGTGHNSTLDILNGYLGQESGVSQSHGNPGPHGFPNTSSRENQSVYSYQDGGKQWPVSGRIGCALDESEEVENRKNKSLGMDESRIRHVSWKDPICSKGPSPEKSLSKLPLKQKDSPPTPVLARSSHFTESPQQQDRKCPLVDRKCAGSPSVLRKFGAMLQENEGKTLVQDGTVTTVIPVEPPKAQNTPVCQRKFGINRASAHAPIQKCVHDSSVSVESGQESRATAGPRHVPQSGEHRGSNYSGNFSNTHTKTPQRVETGTNRKTGGQGHSGQWGTQVVELQADYRMVERILGSSAGSQSQGKGLCHDLIQRRDSKVGEQQFTTGQKVIHESSPAPSRRSFSRPARPANQRPPSRWASHTPTATITTPSGPMCRPPSPARKSSKQPFSNFNNFSLYTETVIM